MEQIIARFVSRLIVRWRFDGVRGSVWAKSQSLALSAALAFAAAPAATNAAVVFSNFGAGDSFDTSGWVVSNVVGGIQQDVAMPFTVTGSSYMLTSLEMALNSSSGGTSSLVVQIMADAAGLPGAVIESLTLSVPVGTSIVTGLSALHPTLVAGTTYWLATDAPVGFDGSWQLTSPPIIGSTAFMFQNDGIWVGFPDFETSAFRINGETGFAVPEPGSIALAALALVGMLVVARTKLSA